MKTKFPNKLGTGIILAAIVIFLAAGLALADAPRITKDQLKEQLGDMDLLIVDVRLGTDWGASEFLIKGAVRVPKENFVEWASKYPKDKRMVLYCA